MFNRDIVLALLKSPQWPVMMRCTYDTSEGQITTPFRELIKKMPGMVHKNKSDLSVFLIHLRLIKAQNYCIVYSLDFSYLFFLREQMQPWKY